jgi:hypothetical protein
VTSSYPPAQPGPRPGPPPGGFRPGGFRPGGFRPGPPSPANVRPGPPPGHRPEGFGDATDGSDAGSHEDVTAGDGTTGVAGAGEGQRPVASTGHPAVDAALRSLDNASGLAPAEQIAAYEDAHRVLQETLASIDG